MANFTKKAIKETFLQLLSERSINKISVKDISDACGINRNSFYYHFADIPSLIEEIVTEEAEKLIEKYPTIDTLENGLKVATEFALENKSAMLHLYNSANRDLFEMYLMNVTGHVVKAYLETAFKDVEVDAEEKEIALRLIKCSCFGMIIDWMNSSMDEEMPKYWIRACELCKGISQTIIERNTK